MDFESPDVEKDFPGLYASDPLRQNQDRESDYSDDSHEKVSKKDLLIGKRKERKESKKDKGYVAFEEESSGGEMDAEQKSPTKSRKGRSAFKFSKRDKSKEKAKDKKEERKEEKEKKKESKVKLKLKDKKKPKQVEDESDKSDHMIFGVPLHVAVDRSKCQDGIELPGIVRECIDYIEEHGLSCEGIYRLSGVKSKVVKLKNLYNSGERVYLYEYEPHIIASLLKLYLRELPEPVLTSELMPKFEEASAMKDLNKRTDILKRLIEELPVCNRTLLSWIFVHMGHIIDRENANKMNVQNVSIVLSPTLQISHRVLNAFFTHGSELFKDVILKRYALPLKQELSKSSLDLPESPSAIEKEIAKQESLLSQLHADIFSGVADREKEEQLWEIQRIVTQLKRNLRLAKRTQKIAQDQDNAKRTSMTEELNLQIDKRLQAITQEQPTSLQLDSNHKCTVYVQWQPKTQPQEDASLALTQEINDDVENEVIIVTHDENGESDVKDLPQGSAEQEETTDLETSKLTPELQNLQSNKETVEEISEKHTASQSASADESDDDNLELDGLAQEEKMLLVQQDELRQLASELKRKIETERSEVGRLKAKMQDLRVLYRYHSFSCDSAENSSDDDCTESDDDDEDEEPEDDEEEEYEETLLKTLLEIQLENKELEQQNKDLIEKIQVEREACLDAKIQIRVQQMKQELLAQNSGKEKCIH